MVFQQPTLFPWKTVLENIAFGPLMAGQSWADAESTARSFMGMVGLAGSRSTIPRSSRAACSSASASPARSPTIRACC